MFETTKIIVRAGLKIGTRSYLTADKFDPDAIISRGLLNEAQMGALQEQNYFAPMTKEAFAVALVRRPGGSPPIPAGFKEEDLLEHGFIEPPKAAKAAKPAAAPETKEAKPKPHRPTQPKPQAMGRIDLSEIEYRGYKITPRARANSPLPPIWYASTMAGDLIRPTGFNKLDAAKAFVDKTLDSEAGADQNGSDIRSGPD